MMTPMLEVVEKLHPEITFSKLDIEAEQDVTVRLNVTSVPTILLYKEGELRYRHVGATSQRVVEAWIAQYLS
jgi:thioredoxin-like negative regulator of GroEL